MSQGRRSGAGRLGALARPAQLGLMAFAAYHLARDALTTFTGVQSPLTDVGHRPHAWCAGACDYVTMPLEVFNLVAGAVVLRRRRTGGLGVINLLTIPLWLLAWLAP